MLDACRLTNDPIRVEVDRYAWRSTSAGRVEHHRRNDVGRRVSDGIGATIAGRILAGKVVPFLGAGANMTGREEGDSFEVGVRLPSGFELASRLLEDTPGYEGRELVLTRVAQHIDLSLGSGPLYERLHALFDLDYPPTPLHDFLARIPALLRDRGLQHQLIVTTNYDDALERAFTVAEEEYDLLVYLSTGPHSGKFLHVHPDGTNEIVETANTYTKADLAERTVIVKIHGAVTRHTEAVESDSYVITEDDYIEYPVHEELSNFVPATLAKHLRTSHLLFLGYSLKDWNLRVILHRLWGSRRLSYKSWAVQAASSDLDTKAWSRRGDVDIITRKLLPFVREVSTQLGLP